MLESELEINKSNKNTEIKTFLCFFKLIRRLLNSKLKKKIVEVVRLSFKIHFIFFNNNYEKTENRRYNFILNL